MIPLMTHLGCVFLIAHQNLQRNSSMWVFATGRNNLKSLSQLVSSTDLAKIRNQSSRFCVSNLCPKRGVLLCRRCSTVPAWVLICQMLVIYLGLLLCLIRYSCLTFQEKDKSVTWMLSLVTPVELGLKAVF